MASDLLPRTASTTSSTQQPAPAKRPRRRSFSGVTYVLPSFAILLVVMIIPIVTSLYYSFTSYSVLGSPTWIGADNYLLLFQGQSFIDAMIVTAIYTLGAVPLQTILSLVIAEAVVRRFRNVFGRVVRSVLFVPVVSSLVVTAVVW